MTMMDKVLDAANNLTEYPSGYYGTDKATIFDEGVEGALTAVRDAVREVCPCPPITSDPLTELLVDEDCPFHGSGHSRSEGDTP